MMRATELNPNVARKTYFQNKLAELRKTIDEADDSDYVVNSVYEVYDKLIENEQFSDIEVDSPVIVEFLVRSYRYIPSYVLDYHNVERVVFGGLFMVVKMCLVPKEMADRCVSSNRWGAYLHPENFGLPSSSEVNYGTIRQVNSKVCSVLLRDEWYDGWIDHHYQYEVVTLNGKM